MRPQKPRKSRWRIAVAGVAMALISCGLLIALDVRKVAAEKKLERRATKEKAMATPTRAFPPLQNPTND